MIISILVAAAAGVWYWRFSHRFDVAPGNELTNVEKGEEGLGAELFNRSADPLKGKLPETNPFKTKTNPLKNIYQNPF